LNLKNKLFIFLLTSPIFLVASEGNDNLSFSVDKKMHFAASFFIAGVSETLLELSSFSISDKKKIFIATAVSFSTGLAKEIKDSREENNYFSTADLSYDLAGSVLGSLTSYYIHKILNKDIDIYLKNKKNVLVSYRF
jgi:uncharacterized protein YfiM (DUF2279 family)